MRVHKLTAIEALRGLGLPGLAGALLLLLAIVWTLLSVLPGVEARDRAQARAQRAEARLASVQRGEVPVSEAPGRLLQDFYAGLPAQPGATTAIDRLYAAAEQENLSLARGEYSLVVERDMALARYQILLPVRGAYPQVRRFLAGALEAVPALSLEDLDLQRKQVSDTELEGRIRMTLYLARR